MTEKKILEKRILLPEMDPKIVSKEIEDFIVDIVVDSNARGGVIGLSGGVDSTTSAALTKKAFDNYNQNSKNKLELVGYIIPSRLNAKEDADDAIFVAEKLGIRYEIQNIEPIISAFAYTNKKALEDRYHKGNLISRIRANVLHTNAAYEKKLVIGTGNRDEDFGVGYYTLFGDGAVHLSPIGALSKRLVKEMATYLGFKKLANRTPTAGLEPGQTDFKDLGYTYEMVELVTEGFTQGLKIDELVNHYQVQDMAKQQFFLGSKYDTARDIVYDIIGRHENVALKKAELISPKIPKITLEYR